MRDRRRQPLNDDFLFANPRDAEPARDLPRARGRLLAQATCAASGWGQQRRTVSGAEGLALGPELSATTTGCEPPLLRPPGSSEPRQNAVLRCDRGIRGRPTGSNAVAVAVSQKVDILARELYLEFSGWIWTHMGALRTLRPGSYTVFRSASGWHSGLAWGAIF